MMDISAQRQLIAALRDPHCYPHAVTAVRVVETHISWVLLAGRYAYKIKKALDLGFLDFTALEQRRYFCAEEIRLNRRLAPKIYLDTVAIGGNHAHPVFDARPAIEYAVRMRRFASGKLLHRLLARNRITLQHIERLAALIARFHRSLPAAEAGLPYGGPDAIRAAAVQNFEQLQSLLQQLQDQELLSAIAQDTEAEFEKCRAVFSSRRELGWVRECHGDLHLGNIALVGDELVPFDGIEFNPELRWLDVMDEAAFLVMDLLNHDQGGLAFRFLNAYLESTGDYAGVSVLRFYLAYRAMVRAKISAIRSVQAGLPSTARKNEMAACHGYLASAAAILKQHHPALFIMHGLPGSGKTTVAQTVLEHTGAIRIRSDVERKRLFGLEALDRSHSRSGAGIYGQDATRLTYAHLLALARTVITAGFPVIVDAAFLRREERRQFAELASGMNVPFAIVSVQASNDILRARIMQRSNSMQDASEAGIEVLEYLQAEQESLAGAELHHTIRFDNEISGMNIAAQSGWDRLLQLAGVPGTGTQPD